MDPETDFDEVRNVGISDGKIAIITEKSIFGKETIEAKGLVVCPGFIEGHVHSTDPFSLKVTLRDGLTTAMDFEAEIRDVANWYAAQEGKQQLNYRHVACAAYTRMAVLDGPDIAAMGVDTGILFNKAVPACGKRAKEEGPPHGLECDFP